MGHTANSHSLLAPIFEICSELGLAVYGHCLHDYGTMPLQYEEMARAFPDVALILGHMGIIWSVGDAIAVATRNRNVYLETSVASLHSQRSAVKAAGAAKVVMGTDWPANDFDLQIEMARRATASVEEFELVVGGNLKAVLRLE
jgi:predicted TIM-barrel fold metal-dependent hydrolase